MITEKRSLPIGIEHDGKVHRELEIRSRLVKDLVAAGSNPRVVQNIGNYEVFCLAQQIVKLGDIPKTEIRGELLLEMDSDDFDVLAEAAEMVRQRTATFRAGQATAQESGATGAGESAGQTNNPADAQAGIPAS